MDSQHAMPIDINAARRNWMAILARANAPELEEASAGLLPAYTRLRGPEIGLVMVQARAGGTGAPFNLGEATVARCTVRTGAGLVGHAYRLGRDTRAAELSAALDAALQDPAQHDAVQARTIRPLADKQAAVRTQTASRAAATQVNFFTLATMRS